MVMWVGSVKVMEFTVTLLLTDTARRFEKPAPGSKNPEPELELAVIVTAVEAVLTKMLAGLALVGVAGGGAISLVARTAHEFVASANSWNVHIVWSSVGSTTTCEKSPHRCVPPTWTLYALELDATDAAAVVPSGALESRPANRSEEHMSELQSHSFISYAVFCLK